MVTPYKGVKVLPALLKKERLKGPVYLEKRKGIAMHTI